MGVDPGNLEFITNHLVDFFTIYEWNWLSVQIRHFDIKFQEGAANDIILHKLYDGFSSQGVNYM